MPEVTITERPHKRRPSLVVKDAETNRIVKQFGFTRGTDLTAMREQLERLLISREYSTLVHTGREDVPVTLDEIEGEL